MIRRFIDVDITDRADGRVPVWRTASGQHEYEDPGGGASESWESVMTDLAANLVHRWPMEDASGNIIDQVGAVDLTPSAALSYAQSSPLGSAIRFASGAVADSAAMGSIPVGAAERTIVCVFKGDPTDAKSTLYSYGTNGTTRLWWASLVNNTTGGMIGTGVWADDLNIGDQATMDGEWHLLASGFGGTRHLYAYYDGNLYARYLAGALNTGSSAPLRVAGEDFGTSNKFTGDIADLAIFDTWLGKPALDRLWDALRRSISS